LFLIEGRMKKLIATSAAVLAATLFSGSASAIPASPAKVADAPAAAVKAHYGCRRAHVHHRYRFCGGYYTSTYAVAAPCGGYSGCGCGSCGGCGWSCGCGGSGWGGVGGILGGFFGW
jgi:hypothetical protein